MQILGFSSFRLWPLYPTGIKVGSQRSLHDFELCLIVNRDTGVQGFGSKSEASVAPVQEFRNQFESPDCLLSKVNRWSDSKSLGDIAV